jgi:site-specific recombinase XerC
MKCRLVVPDRKFLVDDKNVIVPTLFDAVGKPVDSVNTYLRILAWGRKSGTTLAAGRALRVFWEYLEWRRAQVKRADEEPLDLSNLNIADIRRWLTQIKERNGFLADVKSRRPLSGTVRSYRDQLFRFLLWAYENDWITQPVARLNSPTSDSSVLCPSQVPIEVPMRPFLPVPTTAVIDAVKVAISAHAQPPEVQRDLLIFRWAVEVGLRNSEISGLLESDLPRWAVLRAEQSKGTTPTMQVTGKGSKTREVQPPMSLLVDTHLYLQNRGAPMRSCIFQTRSGGRLSQNWISKRFAWYFSIVGEDSHLHRGRAYYIYHLIRDKCRQLARNGKLDKLNITTVIQLALSVAGHENMATLRHYVQLSAMELGLEAPKE